jgi:MHS family proline/betaine transporter-like MFS transporter
MGLGYNTATALLGGTTPMIATLIIQMTGSLVMPAFYLILFAFISFLAV